MNAPAVSIVVATYNYGQFVSQALDSIRAQSFSDWETIIIDDGSTDNTAQIIKPYLRDERFQYRLTSHVGQPSAKNIGIRAARGKCVAFLDADDAWHPEKLARQLPLFDARPQVGVVYCRREVIDPSGHKVPHKERRLHRGNVVQALCLDNFVCFSSSIVRREVFDAVGLFEESLPLAIDYDLWLRAAVAFEFDYVDAPLMQYRTGHSNLSRRSEERLFIVLGILRRFFDSHSAGEIPPTLVRQAMSDTYCSLGLVQRDQCLSSAIANYVRALSYQPTRVATWRDLAVAPIPESARRLIRRALGRPVDWHAARLASGAE